MFHEVVESPFGHSEEGPRSLPFQLGGCGLLSAMRSRVPAHWASWVDSLRTIHCQHPAPAELMVRNLLEPSGFRHFGAAAFCHEVLCNRGYGAPGWRVLTAQPKGLAARVLGVLAIPHEGWQRDASSLLEQLFLDSVLARVSLDQCALLHSQGGPLAALPFTAMPVSPHQRFDSDIFRVLLLRRLSLPLPLSSTLAGVAVLSTALVTVQVVCWQVCWGGGVMHWSLRQHVLDLVGICVQDQRRIEVIAEGLPIFHGVQLAIDTTLVSNLTDGAQRLMEQPWRLLDAARSAPVQSWLVTVNVPSWLCLLGDWRTFLRGDAHVHPSPHQIPEPLRIRARQSWMFRWGSLLACAAARAFASSLLDRRHSGADGTSPSDAEVLADFSRAPLVVGLLGFAWILGV